MLSTPVDAGLEDQVSSARFWLLMERAPMWVLGSGVLATCVAWGIHDLIAPTLLLTWLAVKWLALLPRLIHALWLRQRESSLAARVLWRRHYPIELIALAVDGFVWGSLLWWLTPQEHIHLGAIALSVLLGVSAIRAFSLAIDLKALMAFIAPMLLPNIAFVWSRDDILGTAAAFFLGNFLLLNLLGALQIQRRSKAMLRLRFHSERIAEEKALALEQAHSHSQARTRFLATVSHEMRTPLHGILGLTRVLMLESPRPDQQERLSLIERSGDHLLTVINDILDFSKIESGRMTLDVRPFDLTSLVADVVSVFQVLAQRKGLTLACDVPWQGPREVVGDAGRVRQIMHNLLGNAVKFTDEGHIHVAVTSSDDGQGGHLYGFAVRDTGPGIAPDQIAMIFEPFTQVLPIKAPLGGTGLGLSIAREMCRSMGGDLTCDSTLGQGATFKASMHLQAMAAKVDVVTVDDEPAAPMPVATLHGEWRDTAPFQDTDVPALADARVAGANVLLVEDNAVNVVLTEAMLRNLGCVVHTVTDGQQAVDWLADQSCDVVLMDCTMPIMDGFEATRRIRAREEAEQRSHVPIVAISASTMAADKCTCLDAGMDDHLAKPFTPDRLQAAIARMLPLEDGPSHFDEPSYRSF
jgi:two-component system, sensor histidine kinase